MLFLLLACSFFLVFAQPVDEMYEVNFDPALLETLVSDPAVVKGYVMCFINKVPCNEKHMTHKTILKEAIETACRKCKNDLRALGQLFMDKFKESLPEEYEEFKRLYDPKGKYMDPFLAALAQH